jgi:hypothetical protein
MTLGRQAYSAPLNAPSALTTPDVVVISVRSFDISEMQSGAPYLFVIVSPFHFALVVRFDSQQLERYLQSMYRNIKEFIDEWTVESNISLNRVLKNSIHH